MLKFPTIRIYAAICFFTEDDVQKVVSVCVDGKESQMVFVDHAHADMGVSYLVFITLLGGKR